MKRTLLAVSCILAISQASAAVIDFNELAHDSYYVGVNPLTAGGFLFSNSQGSTNALGVWGRNDSNQADPGYAAVFVNYEFTTTSMTQIGGGSFDFTSIDLADVYNTGVASTIEFTFIYAGGGSTQNIVTLDTLVGLQTFSFNQSNVSSVSWVTLSGDSGWGQFDNVTVNSNGSQVPEPASLALMGLGLAGLAALRRRKIA